MYIQVERKMHQHEDVLCRCIARKMHGYEDTV